MTAPTTPGIRTIITTPVALRLGLGWGSFLLLLAAHPLIEGPLPGPALTGLLAVIVGVIVVCAFGVVIEAEHLATRLGDPYGTLVLTLSIVTIEVILIAAVMLGPGDHTTIARDSVMAVSMIILNLVIGLALLIGGLRHRTMHHNRTGVSTYLALLVVLTTVALALPGLIGSGGAYTTGQAVGVAALTVLLYGFFLYRQTGAQSADFREASPVTTAGPATAVSELLSRHRAELIGRTAVLVATVVPIVLLSHDMATLLDDGLGRLGAPVALSGVLIAVIVFLPETITTLRAAAAGEGQRVSNLCHGALISTVGLTIPAVLIIGMATGQTVDLAETPTNLALLAATLMLSIATFANRRTTAVHGAAHLMLFGIYGITVFA